MENRIMCEHCEGEEFYVLLMGQDEFVQFKCIACEAIIKANSPDEPTRKFMIDVIIPASEN